MYKSRFTVYITLVLSFLLSFTTGCTAKKDAVSQSEKPRVLVTLPPYRYFVQRLIGDRVDTQVLIPPGVSVHHYEPTPREVLEANASVLWLRIGEPVEEQILSAMRSHESPIKILDMRQDLPLLPSSHSHSHSHNSSLDHFDPHIWLSVPLMQTQASHIAKALSELLPEHSSLINEQLDELLTELSALHEELKSLLANPESRYILVTHDAFTYFCHDYKLQQVPIEWKGKDPTVKQLSQVLKLARAEKLTRVFVIPQHSQKGAELIAEELGLQIIEIDPYREDYPDALRDIAKHFAGRGSS